MKLICVDYPTAAKSAKNGRQIAQYLEHCRAMFPVEVVPHHSWVDQSLSQSSLEKSFEQISMMFALSQMLVTILLK